MDNENDLAFDFPLCDKSVYELEKTIKLYLRRYSINIPKEKDIERFSDTYNESKLTDLPTTVNYLIPDLLPTELLEYFGFKQNKQIETLQQNESFNLEFEEEESLEMEISSEIDDDYKIQVGEQDDSTSVGEDNNLL